MSDTDYLDRLEAFAARLKPEAEALDVSATAVAAWYDRFQHEGLNAAGSSRMPLDGIGFCRALETLALASGAFAFMALQQFVANMNVGERFPDGLWPRVGVAFGHLHKIGRNMPVLEHGVANGVVPWLTGAGVFDQVVIGLLDPDAREVFALVAAEDRPAFVHSEPMSLLACAGTRTVTICLRDLPISEEQILKVDPPGNKARTDAEGVLYQTPLLVGCIRACQELIRVSPRIGTETKARCSHHVEALTARVHTAFETNALAEGPRLRAELGDAAVRIARLAAMASGGGALLTTHPAQRLYREALVYTQMAQTDLIVEQAFDQCLP